MASNLTEAEWLLASDDLKVSFNMLSPRIMQLPQKNVQLNAGVFVCLNFRLEDCYYVEYFSRPLRHRILSKTGKGGEICFICQQPSAPCVRWEGMKCTPKCSLVPLVSLVVSCRSECDCVWRMIDKFYIRQVPGDPKNNLLQEATITVLHYS